MVFSHLCHLPPALNQYSFISIQFTIHKPHNMFLVATHMWVMSSEKWHATAAVAPILIHTVAAGAQRRPTRPAHAALAWPNRRRDHHARPSPVETAGKTALLAEDGEHAELVRSY